jgi:hypothetical protein
LRALLALPSNAKVVIAGRKAVKELVSVPTRPPGLRPRLSACACSRERAPVSRIRPPSSSACARPKERPASCNGCAALRRAAPGLRTWSAGGTAGPLTPRLRAQVAVSNVELFNEVVRALQAYADRAQREWDEMRLAFLSVSGLEGDKDLQQFKLT